MHHPVPGLRSRSRCLFCHWSFGPPRYLSTTRTVRAVGPESPKYIDIPEPPQQRQISKRRVKGVLPVPRDIFPARDGGLDKVTDEYLDAATRDAKVKHTWGMTESQRAESDWKLRMTATRKKNLREGLQELQARRRKEEHDLVEKRARVMEEIAENRRIQRERVDEERLTNPTIVEANALCQSAAFLPDPNRFERLEKMRANVAAHAARKVEDRRKSLHELYMNARSFIVNEKDLDAAIDEAFGTTEKPRTWGDRGESIWFEGSPATVMSMSDQSKRPAANKEKVAREIYELSEKRMRRIVEELTGGKMDDPNIK